MSRGRSLQSSYGSSFDPPRPRNLASEIVQKRIRNVVHGDRSLFRSQSAPRLKNANIEWHFQMKHYIQHRMKVLNAKPTINTQNYQKGSNSSSGVSSNTSSRPTTSGTVRSKSSHITEKRRQANNEARDQMREAMLLSIAKLNFSNAKDTSKST
uniref:Uncharacterized protein n=1 Tax=Rhabditophanes sp. KR3021 TaxID=114890 RepID=A0AC35TJC1_9BILA